MTNEGKQNQTADPLVFEAKHQGRQGKPENNSAMNVSQGEPKRSSTGRTVAIVLLALVVVGLLVVSGIVPRLRSRPRL